MPKAYEEASSEQRREVRQPHRANGDGGEHQRPTHDQRLPPIPVEEFKGGFNAHGMEKLCNTQGQAYFSAVRDVFAWLVL